MKKLEKEEDTNEDPNFNISNDDSDYLEINDETDKEIINNDHEGSEADKIKQIDKIIGSCEISDILNGRVENIAKLRKED
jgi:hypothetical protein